MDSVKTGQNRRRMCRPIWPELGAPLKKVVWKSTLTKVYLFENDFASGLSLKSGD